MERIDHKKLIDAYMEKCGFADLFSFPVKEAVLWRVKAGEDIIVEGDRNLDHLFYLVSGKAKIFCSIPGGKTFLLEFLQGGCFLGELELLGSRTESMGVKALSECVLLSLPLDKYREQLLNDTKFLLGLCDSVGAKERRRIDSLMAAQQETAVSRLADFILFASVDGVYKERGVDVSAYLGISYRRYKQVMSLFAKEGCIKRSAEGYRITDRAKLQQYAT